jgi:hypothetical protein
MQFFCWAVEFQIPTSVRSRVARLYIFKPKFPIWVNFGGPWNLRGHYILWHWVNFMAIWYVLLPFGIFMVIWYIFPFWYVVLRKIWQPCVSPRGLLGKFCTTLLNKILNFFKMQFVKVAWHTYKQSRTIYKSYFWTIFFRYTLPKYISHD